MTPRELELLAEVYLEQHQGGIVPPDKAFSPEFAGMDIYGGPLFGYTPASDTYFQELRENPEANAGGLMLPEEWLPGAKTVVSFFLPFSKKVRESNRADMEYPSDEWFHARIEGQDFLIELCNYLRDKLVAEGYDTIVPATDKRFKVLDGYTSNWSERHAAYACGLGTFSLSKGLITPKGVAGRFGSLITELWLPPTSRAYAGTYDYCSGCTACASNCPAGAIDPEEGKDHVKCDAFLDEIRAENQPYYGCGKCQVGVPCECKVPPKKA